jgi:GMP synthase (glutamine-hydrolysing)
MTKSVLFIQNGETDGPGYFATVLSALGIPLTTIHAWAGEPVPERVGHFAGVALGGGGISVYERERYPFLSREMALIQSLRRENVPVLGFCLGAQLIAESLGGKVYANHRKEIGFYDVLLAPSCVGDSLWDGLPTVIRPTQWHGDTFTLPPGAELLASSAITPHQIFRVGPLIYGFQFHLEFDLPTLAGMIDPSDPYLLENGVDPAAFLREADLEMPAIGELATTVFSRWARLLG